MKIQIISSSIRNGRQSHHVALFLQKFLIDQDNTSANIIDLKERNYPLFEERLKFLENKPEGAKKFSDEIKEADAVIIVVPEYNGGYPASLKNVIDLIYDEWQQKPVVLAPVSDGDMAGAQVAQQLEFILYKIGVNVLKARFHVANVKDNFDENGLKNKADFFTKNATSMLDAIKAAVK